MAVGIHDFSVSARPVAHLTNAVNEDAGHEATSAASESVQRLLIERIRRGDRSALEELIAMHRTMVRQLVWRLSGWSGEADDLVQDVFVAVLDSIGRFRGQSLFSTWLTRIAVNVCRRRQRTRFLRSALWRRQTRVMRPETQQDASLDAEQRERAERVTESVRRLKSKYREVIVLRHLQGMEIDEVSRAVGASRGAVMVRLQRGRQMLREMLGPMMEEK
jgi:RNA polymerase sigma-70 factor (ECF subfamily)